MRHTMILLCVVIWLAVTVHDVAAACNTTKVNECVKSFEDKHSFTKEYTITYTSVQLAEMCTEYETLKKCTNGQIENCTEAEKKDFDRIQATSDYLCTVESREIIANHAKCLMENKTKEELDKCGKTFSTEYPSLNDTELCSVMKKFYKCSTDAFVKDCTNDEISWYTKFLDAALEPMKKEANKGCNFTAEPEQGHQVAGCDSKGFEDCVKEFVKKHPEFEFSVAYTEAQLTTICNDYNTAHTCVKEKIKDCNETIKQGWNVIHTSLTHLCSAESKKAIAKHGMCFEKKEVKEEMEKCSKTYSEEYEKNKGKQAELCKVMETFGKCSTGSLTKHCDSGASKWYGEFLDKIMEPAKKALTNCNFKAGCAMTQCNMLLLALALIFSFFFSKI